METSEVRNRLINKWMGSANMSIATDQQKQTFREMIECLTNIELVRPFLIQESRNGISLNQLCTKYKLTKGAVRHQIKCAEKQHTLSKINIKE